MQEKIAASITLSLPSSPLPTMLTRVDIGSWVQESLELDKLDAILKAQGYAWAARKAATSIKMTMTFSVDQDGDLLFTSRVPGQSQVLKCADGSRLEAKALGVRIVTTMHWRNGDIVMQLETHKGEGVTTATITQRYDAATDKIYSHNESVEGQYVRVLKRKGSAGGGGAGG